MDRNFKSKYREYLKSPEWKYKRDLVMDRAWDADKQCWKCERCEAECYIGNVHHLSYENVFNEKVDDQLIYVCIPCHRFIHDLQTDDQLNYPQFIRSEIANCPDTKKHYKK